MCVVILINKGEKEIESPRQFQEHFGFLPEKEKHYNSIEMDACLCQCDLDKTFKENKIEYKIDAGDYFVGMLDQIKGDND